MDGDNILDDMQQDDMGNIRDNHIHGHTVDNNADNMEALINQSFLSFSTLYGMYISLDGAYLYRKWANT